MLDLYLISIRITSTFSGNFSLSSNDLVGLDQEAARQELIAGVKQGRAKPAIAPCFPGPVKHITSEQPSFPGKSVEQDVNTQTNQSEMQATVSEDVPSVTYGPEQLTVLAKRLTDSYNILELGDIARSLNMYVSALPTDKSGMSREIVLFAHKQGRLDELILRLQMDGKL
jgi:hypothetical protein